MNKKFLIVLVLVILLPAAWWIYLKISPDNNINPFYLIPEDAIYVLETDHPIEAWYGISSSLLWQKLKAHPYFDEISADADYLDSLLQGNKRIFKWVGQRRTLISAHMTDKKNYDFLFTVKIEKTLRNGLSSFLGEKVFKAQGYQVTQRSFQDVQILEMFYPADRSTLYMSVINDFLICTYNNSILERAIKASKDPQFGLDPNFLTVYGQTPEKGLSRLYVQFGMLDEYLGCFSSGLDENIKDLSNLLGHHGSWFDIKNEQWILKGQTILNDSIQSYLGAFLRSGESKTSAQSYASNRTAVMLSLGFENFDRFYKELLAGFEKNPDQKATFEKSVRQIESLLNISVRNDLLGWIGSEITFSQMKPSRYSNRSEDIAIFIRSVSEEAAKKKLGLVDKQIKKRTPARFKTMTYKGYAIKYLDVKGFFRLFFGKLFSKVEKPYYVVIDDWVVFSQSPRTLIGIIEDIESGRTLEHDSRFLTLSETFTEKSSLHCYVNLENSFPLISRRLDAESRRQFESSLPHIKHIHTFGIQLAREDELIDTRLFLSAVEPDKENEQLSDEELEAMFRDKLRSGNTDSLSETERFIASQLDDSELIEYYPSTEQIMYRCEIRKGKLHGVYREYFRNGSLKVEGQYKKGRKKGRWQTYDENGRVIKTERY